MNPIPHGYSADAEWECVNADPHRLTLQLVYPENDDIESLIRRLTVDEHAPAINVELTIHARRKTRQPIGLHPILRLPNWPQQLRLDAKFDFGITYPAEVPPGASRVAIGERFMRLDRIRGIHGGEIDYSTLPKETLTEEMLMLCNVRGPVQVFYPAEYAYFRISWDTESLPCCLLWPSDRALADPPWHRRFRGLGIEPLVGNR